MLNIASLLLGLCAWLFAMLAITTKRKFLAHCNCLNSFSLCAISLVLQLFEVQRLIRLVDYSALEDTIGADVLAAVVLTAVTVILNLIALVKSAAK